MTASPVEVCPECPVSTRTTSKRASTWRSFATQTFATRTAALAVRSLLREAEAGPKPGLVDRFSPGAHTDMDIRHFRLSAPALGPYFTLMVATHQPEALRNLGIEAETAMLAATGGVNTHKGAIWTLGLLCAAAGSLVSGQPARRITANPPAAELVCERAAEIARRITGLPAPAVPQTNGQSARGAYGLRSARDEAVAGFPAIRARALPLARSLRSGTVPEDERVITVLLGAMTACDDTCLVARGGIEALGYACRQASAVLDAGGPASSDGAEIYADMVRTFQAGRLSPGGAADLCAAALFLADLEAEPACHGLA